MIRIPLSVNLDSACQAEPIALYLQPNMIFSEILLLYSRIHWHTFIMGILEKIAEIEREMARTQKNKGDIM